jgi:cation diffusion facilitator family transporter
VQDLDGDLGAGWRVRAAAEKSARKFFLMLLLSSTYFVCELVFGVMSGSLTVLADAFHMLTDVAALVCGYWVTQLSMKDATPDKSFGWKRAEIVGALCNGCFLIAVCFTITLEAIEKLAGIGKDNDRDLIDNADKIIVLGCIGLAINLGGMCIFGGHGHSHGIGGGGHSHGSGGCGGGGGGGGHDEHGHGHSHGPDVEEGHGAGCGGGHDHGHGHGHGHGHEHGSAGGHGRQGEPAPHAREETQNLNELSMYLHVLGDALGSAFVVGNACVIKYGVQWGEARLMAQILRKYSLPVN